MRATWWMVALLAIGCSKDGNGVGDDTADTSDTGTDTADTQDTQDTGTPPDPATYGPHNAVKFELGQPVSWVPLEYSEQIFNSSISSFNVTFTLGANVTGKTDLSLTVDSHLDRENDGDYVQYFTGLDKGGQLDAEMHINFPMMLTLSYGSNNISLDVSSLVLDNTIPDANELDWVFDPYIFDTLNLSGDGDSATYTASPYEWSWTSGEIDPAAWAPYVVLDLDATIHYETKFVTTSYEIRDITSDALVATQLEAADRGNVDTYVGALGEEASQVRFDGRAKGEIHNDLSLQLTLTITMYSVIINPAISIPITRTFELGDDGQWKVTLDEERITHPKQ